MQVSDIYRKFIYQGAVKDKETIQIIRYKEGPDSKK